MAGRQKESELLNAWLWAKHREDPQWKRVRLGMVPNPEMANMYKVILRWADAIFLHDGEVYIVEAKLRPGPGAVGQLELYGELFRRTPEFSMYETWPIHLVLLTAYQDLEMMSLCEKKGIIYEYFPWPSETFK